MEENFDLDSGFTDLAAVDTPPASLDIVAINKSELFSKENCEKILAGCIEELWLPTKVVGDKSFHSAKRQKLRGDVAGFPFMEIRDVTKSANIEIYDFNLLGIIDQDFPQIFKYQENDYYNWHMELTPMAPSRKITFIINLSDDATYEGGQLEFLNTDAGEVSLNKQGDCLIFPSYMTWKINPVTKGNKCIIVGHVHGAIFK
jgi:PKHD-type hydroxylase